MEKTLKEFVKPHQKRFDYHNSQRIYIDKADVLKLLQQVREATIAECLQLALRETIIMSRKSQFDLIPTNRIKIKQ